MADKYTIDFTDQNTNRSFIVTPFSVNGPVNPTSGMLDPMATSASTSLRLVGKGLPEYGERVLENLVHLLEHFAGDKEPTYPINGQIWFNKQVTPQQLCIYSSLYSVLRPSVAHPADVSWYYVDGDQVTRLSGLQKIRIVNGTTGVQEEYTISDVTLKLALTPENPASVDRTEFKISPPPSTSRANVWYIGGWEYILQNNAPLRAHLNANNHRIINLSTPILNTDAVTKQYVDTEISTAVTDITNTITDLILDDLADVAITTLNDKQILAYDQVALKWRNRNVDEVGAYLQTGGTITGNVIINGTTETGALTVNGNITHSGGNIDFQGGVNIQGDVDITGNMTFQTGNNIILPGAIGDFTLDDEVVNKRYVDAAVGGVSTALGLDELTDVTLASINNDDLLMFDSSLGTGQWVNRSKSYVTSVLGDQFVLIGGSTMSGILILSAHPTTASPALQAATKGYVDSAIANISMTGGSGVSVTSGEYLSDEDILILHQGADLILPVLVADEINNAFEIDGDLTIMFKDGDTFEVRCSVLTTYTVAPAGANYDAGTNTTTIPVTADLLPGMTISLCEINSLTVMSVDDVNDTFTISDDHVAEFGAGTVFGFVCWNSTTTSYVVETPGSTYSVVDDRTVIPVTTSVPAGMLTSGPCEISGTGFGTADVFIPMNISSGTTALKTYDVNHPVVGYDQYASDYPTNVWETTLLNNLVTAGASREISLRTIVEEFSTLFGAFAEPKFRSVVATTGSSTYQISGLAYDVGYNTLSVFVNGIKQIASECGNQSVYNTSVKKWPSMSTGLLNTTTYGFNININGAGNTAVKFGGQFGIIYSELVNTLNRLGNTNTVLDVYAFDEASNQLYISGDVASLFPSGKTFNMNCVVGPTTLSYTTSAAATFDSATNRTAVPVTTNLLIPSLKKGASFYTVISYNGTTNTFVVSGNQTAVFTAGSSFTAEGATNPVYSQPYTVSIAGPTFDGTNTTIPVDSGIFAYGLAMTGCSITGVGLGFGVSIAQGRLLFVSDLAGSGSSIVLTDGASGATNMFATLFTTPAYSSSVSVTTDYAYQEIGSYGKVSDTVTFHAASTPPVGSVIEIIVDRRVIR